MLQVIAFLLTLQFLTQIRCCVLFIGLVLLAGLVLYIIVRFDDINIQPSNGNLKKRKPLWVVIAFLSCSVMLIAMILLLKAFANEEVINKTESNAYLVFFAGLSVASLLSSVFEEDISRHCWLKAVIVIICLIPTVGSLLIASFNISGDCLNGVAFIVIVISSFFAACASRLFFLCWKTKDAKVARVHAVDTMAIASIVGVLLTITTLVLQS